MGAWNIGRGLFQKEKEISEYVDKKEVNILFLQETDIHNDKKKPYQLNEELTSYFPMVRENEKTRIICFVDKDTNVSIKQRKDLMDHGFQSIWMELERKNKRNILISGFYREWGKTSNEKCVSSQMDRLSIFLSQRE